MSQADDANESDEVRRAPESLDEVVTEAWERVTDEPDIRCVCSGYLEPYGEWSVDVAVMEFVREGDPPYEGLRDAIESALRDVSGVTHVLREDTETWIVRGAASGRELTAVVAQVVDARANELRAWYSRPN